MKLTLLTNCADIWCNNAPNCTISCLNFFKFSGEGLTDARALRALGLGFALNVSTPKNAYPISYRHFFFSTSSPVQPIYWSHAYWSLMHIETVQVEVMYNEVKHIEVIFSRQQAHAHRQTRKNKKTTSDYISWKLTTTTQPLPWFCTSTRFWKLASDQCTIIVSSPQFSCSKYPRTNTNPTLECNVNYYLEFITKASKWKKMYSLNSDSLQFDQRLVNPKQSKPKVSSDPVTGVQSESDQPIVFSGIFRISYSGHFMSAH